MPEMCCGTTRALRQNCTPIPSRLRKVPVFLQQPYASLFQVIDAEVARRKLLEDNPIPSINEEPVNFDTSEIPWWAWVKRFHLPEVRKDSWALLDRGTFRVRLACGCLQNNVALLFLRKVVLACTRM